MSDNFSSFDPRTLGGGKFLDEFNVDLPVMAGSMANAISSPRLVIAMAQNGMLASYGTPNGQFARVKQDIENIKQQIGDAPFACCLIHRPSDLAHEEKVVELFIELGVKIIEASAFMSITPALVLYRATGLEKSENQIQRHHKIIAKLSRPEIAEKFLSPPPLAILENLLAQEKITRTQFELAQQLPLCDAMTVEADSGGHTDRRPGQVIVPVLVRLRNELCEKYNYNYRPLVGQAGGICSPESVLSAFILGAEYVVTGSINQCTVEAGTSDLVKARLASAQYFDVAMAQAADMFEYNIEVQVLKKLTLYPEKSRLLRETYEKYNSLEEIPENIRRKLESWVFKKSLVEIWNEIALYNESKKDAENIEVKNYSAKQKMMLVFRWYLAKTSRWAIEGLQERALDFQVWCGASMGGFNQWVKGSKLEDWRNRSVAAINKKIFNATFSENIDSIIARPLSVPRQVDEDFLTN